MGRRMEKEKSSKNTQPMKHPDPQWHLYISLVKSFFRILAGGFLMLSFFVEAGALIVAAELLGIAEELV